MKIIRKEEMSFTLKTIINVLTIVIFHILLLDGDILELKHVQQVKQNLLQAYGAQRVLGG